MKNVSLYVGTYRKYNDGNLGGMWVDMTTFSDDDEFFDFCRLLKGANIALYSQAVKHKRLYTTKSKHKGEILYACSFSAYRVSQ